MAQTQIAAREKPNQQNRHWVSRKNVKGGGYYRKNRGRKRQEKTTNTKRNVAIGASALVGAGLALKNRKTIHKTFNKTKEKVLLYSTYALDHPTVEKGFRNFEKLPLPQKLKDSANNLIGQAKVMLSVMHSEAAFGKATLKSVNTKHNYSSYILEDNSILSIGSVGRNVVTFQSYPNPNKGDNDTFENLVSAFSVNNSYEKVEVDPSTSKKIIAATRSMFEDQVKYAPDNTIFMASPYDNNPKLQRAKRNIYMRSGFYPVSEGSDWIWAMKENGKLKRKLTPEDFEKVGFREDYGKKFRKTIEFKKPLSAKHKMAISSGMKDWWNKQVNKNTTEEKENKNKTRLDKKKIAIGASALVGSGLVAAYGLKKYRSGKLRKQGIAQTSGKKGSVTNPIVEQITPEGDYSPYVRGLLSEKSAFQSRVKGAGFWDKVAGKFRKRGQILPGIKKGDVNAKVIQEPMEGLRRKSPQVKQIKLGQEEQVKIAVDATNRKYLDAGRRLTDSEFKLKPYKVINFRNLQK